MGQAIDSPQAPATGDSQALYDKSLVTIEDIKNDPTLTEEQKQQQMAAYNQELHNLGFPSDLQIVDVQDGHLIIDDTSDSAGAYAEDSAAFALDFRPLDSATADNGAGYQATRDGYGQITQVKVTGADDSQTIWKLENGQYVAYDAAGAPIEGVQPASDVRTRSDGAIEIVSNGTVQVINADGTSMIFNADANGNATGKPVVVDRGNGEAYLLQYDDSGNLIGQTIVDDYGTENARTREVWTFNTSTGGWERKNEDGTTTPAGRPDTVDVAQDGTIIVSHGGSEAGIVERRNPDGSTVVTNAEGRVTSVTSPDGFVRSYEYNSEGDLVRYTEGSGETATSYKASNDDPNTFINEKTGEARTYTDVTVNEEGTLLLHGTDGVTEHKTRLNEDLFEFPENPGTLVRNDGRVDSVRRENGVETSYQYDGWGNGLRSVTTNYPDGSYVKASLNADGTWEVVSGGPGVATTTQTVDSIALGTGARGFSDGSMSYVDADGNRVELGKDGSRTVTTADGGLISTSFTPDGLATVNFKTETKTGTLIQNADGTWSEILIGANGASEPRVADDVTIKPDGIVYTVQTDSGPRRVAQYTSGVRIVGTVGADGKMGDVTLMYVPGSDGQVRTWKRDSEGNFVSGGIKAKFTSENGNRVLTYEEDGRIVTQTIDGNGNITTSVSEAPAAEQPADDQSGDGGPAPEGPVNAGTGAPADQSNVPDEPEQAAESEQDEESQQDDAQAESSNDSGADNSEDEPEKKPIELTAADYGPYAVAERVLGPNASQEEIWQYIEKICVMNGLPIVDMTGDGIIGQADFDALQASGVDVTAWWQALVEAGVMYIP